MFGWHGFKANIVIPTYLGLQSSFSVYKLDSSWSKENKIKDFNPRVHTGHIPQPLMGYNSLHKQAALMTNLGHR